MKYIIFILFFNALYYSSANSYNPQTLAEKDYFDSSDLILDSVGAYTFLIKHHWANDSETIISFNSSNESAILLNNLRILDYQLIEDILYLICIENSVYKIIQIDKSPNIINDLTLPLEIKSNDEADFLLKDNKLFLKVGNNLLFFNDITDITSYNIIDNSVEELEYKNNDALFIYYLQKYQGLTYLCKHNIINSLIERVIVESADNAKLIIESSQIILLLNQNMTDETFIQVFDENNLSLVSGFWIDSKLNLIDINSMNNQAYFSYIYRDLGRYSIALGNAYDIQTGNIKKIELSHSVIEPLVLSFNKDTLTAVFKNSVLVYDVNFTEIAFDYIAISDKISSPLLTKINDMILLSDSQGILVLSMKYNKLWRFYYYYDIFLQYLIPMVLIIIIIMLLQMYRHTKRVHRELLNLPSAGIIMEFDSVGRLLRANKAALDLISYDKNIPKRRIFSYYLNHGHLKPFSELINNSLKYKINKTSHLTFHEREGVRELKCSVIALKNIAGIFRGIVFTAIDITEQLERKRLTNWAQLAHDMQTNLSTIKLNAEHIDSEEHTDNFSRRKKILHQVNVLMQRVRDIVTVGRNDILEISEVSASDLILAARGEFDDTVFPNVNFKITADSFLFSCDKAKLVRAIRNAIENAIKALPDKSGNLIIACYKDKSNAYFSIKDDGIGMENTVKEKMMQPYFTTGERSGGFGIGTMIMQHVADLHGGRIDIKSEKNVGTEIIFIIPLKRT